MNKHNNTHKTTVPPSVHEINELKVKDYGESITNIAKQTRFLEHALPLGKPDQIEVAFKDLQQGVYDLHTFLRVRGFDV